MAGLPAQAAAPKVLKATITLPGHDVSGPIATGRVEGETIPSAVPIRQTCPGPGPFDGQHYKFFDLGAATGKVIKAYGPKPAVTQIVPGLDSTYNEYDIDVSGFDAKCNYIEGPTGFTGGSTAGSELYKPKKPVRFIVVNYYSGPYKDLPITVEVTT
jgi:hypothetical protein